jgi:chorismate lyase/3-hydroxybenzoate synthase
MTLHPRHAEQHPLPKVISPTPLTFAGHQSLKVAFGPNATGIFDVGVPVLAGEAVESLFVEAMPAGHAGSLSLFNTGNWFLGAATVPLHGGLEAAAHKLYATILGATREMHLARIWNYVPAINNPGPDGTENYRLFCRGRSLAFEQHHGEGFKAYLPSASAVGSRSTSLTVAFAANPATPRHVENPLQVPAYDYPEEYGPRAPSFARATVVPGAQGSTVFISGTAAIRGHETLAAESTRIQLEYALENLDEISRACGIGACVDKGGPAMRHFKVYVRHAADQAIVAAMLERELFTSGDSVSYLQADICRAPLLVEIEASLFGVRLIS